MGVCMYIVSHWREWNRFAVAFILRCTGKMISLLVNLFLSCAGALCNSRVFSGKVLSIISFIVY